MKQKVNGGKIPRVLNPFLIVAFHVPQNYCIAFYKLLKFLKVGILQLDVHQESFVQVIISRGHSLN
jgi:hypothetical protein